MKYCTKCVLPDTHETIAFDENGVCNICRQAEIKHEAVNWEERGEMLLTIIERYKDNGQYDCIVPFSGGKDSAFQLWYVVKKLNLKPLVVRFDHWGYRPLVQDNNIRVFKTLGVDVLQFTPDWKVVKQLMLESLKRAGDFCWHCHTGIFAYTMQVSVKFGIPLVIWGESGSEYRAYRTFEEIEELDEKYFSQVINLGIDAHDMYQWLGGGVSRRDLAPFVFPSKEELEALGAKSIWLGNYIEWDTLQNVKIIKEELGWQGARVEGIPPEYDYEKIECMWQGVRDYCKLIKRGHGRTNHLACIDIRAGRMTREEGLKLISTYDGKRPASLDLFLNMLDITEDEFMSIVKKTSVNNYDFDSTGIITGETLPDMKDWKV